MNKLDIRMRSKASRRDTWRARLKKKLQTTPTLEAATTAQLHVRFQHVSRQMSLSKTYFQGPAMVDTESLGFPPVHGARFATMP